MARQFRWVDVPLLLAPGLLCVWGAYATSQSGQEDVRNSFPVGFLIAFCLYVGAFVGARLLVPYRARFVAIVWLLPLAFLSLFAGGLSMGAGYVTFAFVCAPLFGALFGVGAMPASARIKSVAVSA